MHGQYIALRIPPVVMAVLVAAARRRNRIIDAIGAHSLRAGGVAWLDWLERPRTMSIFDRLCGALVLGCRQYTADSVQNRKPLADRHAPCAHSRSSSFSADPYCLCPQPVARESPTVLKPNLQRSSITSNRSSPLLERAPRPTKPFCPAPLRSALRAPHPPN